MTGLRREGKNISKQDVQKKGHTKEKNGKE
jgi:hypothetical protein